MRARRPQGWWRRGSIQSNQIERHPTPASATPTTTTSGDRIPPSSTSLLIEDSTSRTDDTTLPVDDADHTYIRIGGWVGAISISRDSFGSRLSLLPDRREIIGDRFVGSDSSFGRPIGHPTSTHRHTQTHTDTHT